jgi:hypothetical protein
MRGVGVILGLLMISSVATASGTGVGNGSDGALAENYRTMLNQLRVSNPSNIDDILSWCARVSSLLEVERDRAMLQVQFNHLASARAILMNALRATSDSLENSYSRNSLTKRIVDRGLLLGQALEDALPEDDRLSEITKTDFLVEYAKFVIKSEQELDRPLYVPYRHLCCHECGGRCPQDFNLKELERQSIENTRRQLEFVAEHFSTVTYQYGEQQVFPVGKPKAFLRLAELVSLFASIDLADNLFAYSNTEEIAALKTLSDTLARYNLCNDRTVYPNDRWAVTETRMALDRITNSLESCRGRY